MIFNNFNKIDVCLKKCVIILCWEDDKMGNVELQLQVFGIINGMIESKIPMEVLDGLWSDEFSDEKYDGIIEKYKAKVDVCSDGDKAQVLSFLKREKNKLLEACEACADLEEEGVELSADQKNLINYYQFFIEHFAARKTSNGIVVSEGAESKEVVEDKGGSTYSKKRETVRKRIIL